MKVLCFSCARADYGLVKPVHDALNRREPGSSVLSAWNGLADRDCTTDMKEVIDHVVSALADVRCLLVYGDRVEAHVAATVAHTRGVSVVHMEGGDITLGGCFDDRLRYAISAIADWHLTTNAYSAQRLISMHYPEERVINVGYIGCDYKMPGNHASAAEIEMSLGICPQDRVIVFVQHPVPMSSLTVEEQIEPSIEALKLVLRDGARLVLLSPNRDPGHEIIRGKLDGFARDNGLMVHDGLGASLYHGLLAYLGRNKSGRLVGNSSSGIKEAGWYGVPAIDVGRRQWGRLAGPGVVRVPHKLKSIYHAAVDPAIKLVAKPEQHPYRPVGDGLVADSVAEIITNA